MEHLVDGVVGANDSNEPDDSSRKMEVLPRPAQVLGVVHDFDPVLLVHRHLDVVRVTPDSIFKKT